MVISLENNIQNLFLILNINFLTYFIAIFNAKLDADLYSNPIGIFISIIAYLIVNKIPEKKIHSIFLVKL